MSEHAAVLARARTTRRSAYGFAESVAAKNGGPAEAARLLTGALREALDTDTFPPEAHFLVEAVLALGGGAEVREMLRAVLQASLDALPPGTVPTDARSDIEYLLARVWDTLERDDGGMAPYKLLGRTEDMTWEPPVLSFTIERHGGTVLGSRYAELQDWRVNLDNGTAHLERPHQPRKRALRPAQKAIKTGPIADELAAAIQEGREDPRLQYRDGYGVRVVASETFPRAPKQTTEGRMARLHRDLGERLPGWTSGKTPGSYWRRKEGVNDG